MRGFKALSLLKKKMKLFRSPNAFLSSLQNLVGSTSSRISTAASSSTETLASNSLLFRVTHGADHRASIFPILEQWVDEGRPLNKGYLQEMVKKLRRMKRHSHALEVSIWMSDRRYFVLSAADLADRLGLIYKVRGLEHAENYFKDIPKQKKIHQTYGSLLYCYAQEKSVEKAESLFETMKELNLLSSFPYNTLMSLYSRTGQHEKLEMAFEEMKEKGIHPNTYTDNILLDAYATALNISRMEGVLERLEQLNAVDSHQYAITARAYVKAGLKDKALDRLKMAEKLVSGKNSKFAWGFLVTLYADIGNKDEMYRIWNACKSSMGKAPNSMYLCMISGLLKLDDLGGAEEFFKEWKSQVVNYDIRIPKLLIGAYWNKGLLGKAECLVSEAVQSGEMLSSNTWAQLASGYFEVNQIPKAVEMMKAVVPEKTLWRPSPENMSASLKYFGEHKDVEAAEEFVRLTRQLIPLTREIYQCLIRAYLIAGEPVSGVLERMRLDGFVVDEETNKILEVNW